MNALHPGRIMIGEEKMESLWSVLTSSLPCRKARSKAGRNKDIGSITGSKEFIGLDEAEFEGKFEKNDEPPRYSLL